jgi:O-antigen/teichoic acid export membrane protein
VAIVVARALGPANRGIYFLATLVATMIGLVGSLGMASAAIVYGANQRVPPRELHGLAICLSVSVGLLGTALLVIFEHVLITSVLKGMNLAMLILVGASIAPLIYGQVLGAMLTGMGHVPAVSVMRIGLAVALPIITVPAVVVWSGHALAAVAAWLIVTTLFAMALGWYGATRLALPAWPSHAALRTVGSFSIRGHVGTLAAQGFLRTDFLFVSAYLGPTAVGLYSQASVLAERMTTLGHSMYSSSANRLGSDPPKEAAELAAELIRVLLLVMVPVAVVLAVLAHPIMVILFGSAFGPSAKPFAILLPGTVCLTLWYVLSLYILSSLRRPGTTTLIQGTGLLIALPLYWLAVKHWGYNGTAAVSTLIYSGVFAAGLWFLLRSPYVTWRQLVPTMHDVRHMIDVARRGIVVLRRRFYGGFGPEATACWTPSTDSCGSGRGGAVAGTSAGSQARRSMSRWQCWAGYGRRAGLGATGADG